MSPLNPAEIAGLSYAYGATFDDRRILSAALRLDPDTHMWLVFDADVPTVQAVRAIYVMSGAHMRDGSIPDAEPATVTTVWGTPIEPSPAFDAAAFDAAFPPATVPDAEPTAFRADLRIDAFGQAYHAPAAESALLHTAEILTMLDTRPVHGPHCALDGSCEGCSCKACDGPLSADEARRGALCPMCELNYR